MDNEPGTSIEADKNLAADLETTCSKKKQNGGGGTTCCIPKCDSNTKKNPELSFYLIPTDMKLRNMWLHWIGRATMTRYMTPYKKVNSLISFLHIWLDHKLPWITSLEKSVSTFFMFKCFSRLVVRCFFSIQYQMFL